MNAPVLVILAAGMGSRYGGLKQIDPVDERGNKIIDFSIYDALRAGFKKVVFVIKKENLADFKSCIGDRIRDNIEIEYVFQDISMIPDGYSVPEGREKPWGTAHAALCAKEAVNSPFAVINSDDFYGREAFTKIYDFLSHTSDDDKYRYAMVGFALRNTLTENGSVSRGICTVNGDGELTDITERTKIVKTPGGAAYTENGSDYIPIPEDSIVSMNFWGYSESFLREAELQFREFLENEVVKNPMKAEFYLPSVVDRLLKEDRAEVKVLKSEDKWFGVTYREDKPLVMESIKRLKDEGVYPDILWV